MKNMRFLIIGKAILLTICVLSLMPSTATAQERVRYILTKFIDADGVVSKASELSYFTFNGNMITYYTANNMSFPFQYHHTENNCMVYYQVATDMINGKRYINENSQLLVSSDKNTINSLHFYNGQIHLRSVFKKQTKMEIGGIYE